MAKKRESEVEQQSEQPREFAPPQETWESFRRRHGDYVAVDGHEEFRTGGEAWTIIFEDGATASSTDRINHGGQDPNPADIVGNGHMRLRYAEEKLNRELKAYERYRTVVMEQAEHHLKHPHACPPPDANWEQQLEDGEKRIERWQARIAELNDILNKLDPARIEKRERAEADLAAHTQRKATYDRVMSRLSQLPNIAPLA